MRNTNPINPTATQAKTSTLPACLRTPEDFYADLLSPAQDVVLLSVLVGWHKDDPRRLCSVPAHPSDVFAASTTMRFVDGPEVQAFFHQAVYAAGKVPRPIYRDNEVPQAVGATSLWVDMPVGSGGVEGPPTGEAATLALYRACRALRIPQPTHVVDAGNAVRATWRLDAMVGVDEWRHHQRDLLAVLTSRQLEVFDEIAGIDTPFLGPGVLNFTTGQPTCLLKASTRRLKWVCLRESICKAVRNRSGIERASLITAGPARPVR